MSALWRNEKGSIINVAMLVLLLLSLVGIAVSRSMVTDLQISNNFRTTNLAFFNAEAARAFVEADSALYGIDNITPGVAHQFHSNDSATLEANGINFSGEVEYLTNTTPPRGSGYASGTFRAHRYRMDLTGSWGDGDKTKNAVVNASFYRIGF